MMSLERDLEPLKGEEEQTMGQRLKYGKLRRFRLKVASVDKMHSAGLIYAYRSKIEIRSNKRTLLYKIVK